MKVALVGLGHIARHQLEAIRRLKGEIALAGVYDRDPRAPAKFGLHCPIHKSLDQLIAQSDADVVVVSTPNRDHFATTSRLLKAGRAVMVEKPVCDRQDQLRTLIALAKTRKLFLHAALHAAFARDLNWWKENRNRLGRRFGPLEHFHMGFYDPYIGANAALEKSARGLGGSWDDSGINALSVLAVIADPASIKVTAAGMFATPGIDCLQVNGWARLTAEVDGRRCSGQINTDWMLGLNRKTTLLSYAAGTILLDHSNQQVVIAGNNSQPKIVSLRNGTSRLTNQYVGVFRDLAASFRAATDNSRLSAKLHALLFAAARRG